LSRHGSANDFSIGVPRSIHRGLLFRVPPGRPEQLPMSLVPKDGTARAARGRQFGLLAAVISCLAALTLLAPLMAGEHSEARVGVLLILAALVQIHHGFRRISEQGQRSLWQSGAVTLLMGMLILNSETLAFSAFVLFLGGTFAIDAGRHVVRGVRNRDYSAAAWATWIIPALANAAVAAFLIMGNRSATTWTVAIVSALRMFGIAWDVFAAEVHKEEDSARTAVGDLGLGDDPRARALGAQLEAEETARASVDRGWVVGFIATLFAIHLARMGFDRSALGILGPAFAVFGDLVVALIFAWLVVVPVRLLWRKATRFLERHAWQWSGSAPGDRLGRLAQRIVQRWLSGRLRFAIRLRLARYDLRAALRRGLQIGLPFAAVMAAVIPMLGMNWYFDTENWAAGIWDSWAAARTDVWREAMVTEVAKQNLRQDATAAGAVQPPGVATGDFAFVVIGDTGEGDASQHVLRDQLIAATQPPEVRFVVISSDVIYPTGEMKDYEAKFWLPFKGVTKPVYAIPGNHDWYDALEGFNATFLTPAAARIAMRARVAVDKGLTTTTDSRIGQMIAQAETLRGEYRVPTGFQDAPFFQMQTDDFALIAVDTGVVRRIDEAQMRWLKAALEAARGKFIMAILGHPLFAQGHYQAAESPDFSEIHALLRAHGVQLVMAGDVHDFEYYAEPPATSGEPSATMHHFVNGGGGAYLSVGTALDFPAQPVTPLWAHYPMKDELTKKIETLTPAWKWPMWWWTKRFGGWPSSVEWLSAAFDYNVAPFFQSFVVVRVERSANRVRVQPWGVHGRLRWSDIASSPGVRPEDVSSDTPAEWVIRMGGSR
jgi:uncharacterized membrane protein HdeD (DUF308 family)/3',5'-cyclic AMP phosphodiesterase CpdA